MPDIDFGFNRLSTNDPVSPDDDEKKTDLDTGKEDNKDDTTNIDSNNNDNTNNTEEGKEDNKETNDDNKNDDNKNDDSLELVSGTKIEIGNDTYTVDDKGNLIDNDGKIFKESSEVAEYLKTLEQADEDGKDFNINNVIETIGIDILDDNDKPVEFENSPEGIKQYVDAVIKTSQQEIAESTINGLYQRYPIVQEVLNYYIANGNSIEGFSEHPDRSNIEIEENNENQQESIIRTAWKEQNRKGDVDSYIAYLKSSGTLKNVAEQELQGLKDADAAYKQKLADEAKEQERIELEKQTQYWNGVKSVIETKNIAGYKIPDTIIIERNGKKVAATPNDFFNYIYRTDKEGYTQYQRDLAKESAESRRDDEILRAYLKFVGGNYSNLVDMAISEKEVNKLRVKAKENNSHKRTYKVTPPNNNNDEKKQVNLGY